jgi:hypothetical protein
VRGAEAFVADDRFGVEPGATNASGARDQVEGDRATVGLELAKRLTSPLQGLLAPAGCRGA